MISEKLHALHAVELGFLQSGLEEEGFTTQFVEKSPELPLHVLLLSLGQDGKGRDRWINFNFVPLPDEEIENIRLLQLYSVVPCTIRSDRQDAVRRLLHAVNCVMPIGGYGIKEDGEVFIRYVYSASASRTLSPEELLEVVSLFNYMLELFAERIEDVASGAASLEDALAAINP